MKSEKCNRCGSTSLVREHQSFKNGTIHHRVTCFECGVFNGFAKREREKAFEQRVCYFPKHKGKTWEQVFKEDPDYLYFLATKADIPQGLRLGLAHLIEIQERDQRLN